MFGSGEAHGEKPNDSSLTTSVVTMSKAPISLRPAASTIEDGRVFARLLDEAQEGYFRAMLGRRAGDIIAQAFTEPGHDLSHQYVAFAEQSGLDALNSLFDVHTRGVELGFVEAMMFPAE